MSFYLAGSDFEILRVDVGILRMYVIPLDITRKFNFDNCLLTHVCISNGPVDKVIRWQRKESRSAKIVITKEL